MVFISLSTKFYVIYPSYVAKEYKMVLCLYCNFLSGDSQTSK